MTSPPPPIEYSQQNKPTRSSVPEWHADVVVFATVCIVPTGVPTSVFSNDCFVQITIESFFL